MIATPLNPIRRLCDTVVCVCKSGGEYGVPTWRRCSSNWRATRPARV